MATKRQRARVSGPKTAAQILLDIRERASKRSRRAVEAAGKVRLAVSL